MSTQIAGLRAYNKALEDFTKAEKVAKSQMNPAPQPSQTNDFADVFKSSLGKVNDLQTERSAMITSFASGENQNVHELMIAMQKASLAMNMTAAVRNKVMDAYKELSRMQF